MYIGVIVSTNRVFVMENKYAGYAVQNGRYPPDGNTPPQNPPEVAA